MGRRDRIKRAMADYIMLRKGRNALSTAVHVILNIALAVVSTALTVISGNWIFGVLLVLLSKWRVVAVRPRYWILNIKSNLVDFTVGVSLALLVYMAGTDGLNAWHIILTVIYIIWLIGVKPRSETIMTEIQSLCAVFFGTFATTLITTNNDPLMGVLICFVIGYGASRHVLMQGEEHDYTLTTFIFGIMMAELYWIFYHWSIVYTIQSIGATISVPQLPIAATTMFFVFARGYKSAVRHDGFIRSEDIRLPVIFSVLLMVVMIFFFSGANFNI